MASYLGHGIPCLARPQELQLYLCLWDALWGRSLQVKRRSVWFDILHAGYVGRTGYVGELPIQIPPTFRARRCVETSAYLPSSRYRPNLSQSQTPRAVYNRPIQHSELGTAPIPNTNELTENSVPYQQSNASNEGASSFTSAFRTSRNSVCCYQPAWSPTTVQRNGTVRLMAKPTSRTQTSPHLAMFSNQLSLPATLPFFLRLGVGQRDTLPLHTAPPIPISWSSWRSDLVLADSCQLLNLVEFPSALGSGILSTCCSPHLTASTMVVPVPDVLVH